MSFPPLAFHVEPERGWLNDPNGLCYFGGKYHAYYQHNPTATVWTAPLSWGHAVSEDLLHWEPAPIALSPDMPYESTGGFFSGSAYVEEGKIWFFYTAVGEDGVQTQCLATSEDGYHLEKYPGNPILTGGPIDPTGRDFRDPKVFRWSDGSYRMVCGTGYEGRAAVVLYKSQDKLAWEYAGILFETRDMGPVLECPDLYPVEDKWVLCFSRMDQPQRVTFLVGDFDGERFTPESVQHPAVGPNFYAPQSFLDPQGRRLVLGWMTPWGAPEDPDPVRSGCLTVPLEVTLDDAGTLCLFPVEEADSLLQKEDPCLRQGEWLFQITDGKKLLLERPAQEVWDARVLADTHTREVFINGGEQDCSSFLEPDAFQN